MAREPSPTPPAPAPPDPLPVPPRRVPQPEPDERIERGEEDLDRGRPHPADPSRRREDGGEGWEETYKARRRRARAN